MPFEIRRADLTKLDVDAIVNAANQTLLGGGGVDGAIHKAAGPELLEECRALGGCATGEAKITKGYRLPARYVIHTVGPVWRGGGQNEEQLLQSCYRRSMELAAEHGLASIAFPLISAGIYGYPKEQALKIALAEITNFLLTHELYVYLVVYNKEAFAISEKIFASVESYIEEHLIVVEDRPRRLQRIESDATFGSSHNQVSEMPAVCSAPLAERRLEDVLAELEETFSEQLLRYIDQKGLTDVVVYKGANIDRKLFSKIRSDREYRPSKATALALAIALKLSFDETRDLLGKAGYALSPCSKYDLIIEYFIQHGNYDIHQINETLFAFDQSLLGA
jgi:O-acetyl-ADP-ribose deacetylase (regulator of RNase III)